MKILRFGRMVACGATVLSLAACGGFLTVPTGGFNPGVNPKNATVAPLGTVEIGLWMSEAGANSFIYTVDGGPANGTIVQDSVIDNKFIYTAPATPGNYIARVGFTYYPGQTFIGIVKIKVQ